MIQIYRYIRMRVSNICLFIYLEHHIFLLACNFWILSMGVTKFERRKLCRKISHIALLDEVTIILVIISKDNVYPLNSYETYVKYQTRYLFAKSYAHLVWKQISFRNVYGLQRTISIVVFHMNMLIKVYRSRY